MGATYAIGVDIDPAAISSVEYNASLNNLKLDTLQVYVASTNGKDPVLKDFIGFDIVVANILLNSLVELAGQITNPHRGKTWYSLTIDIFIAFLFWIRQCFCLTSFEQNFDIHMLCFLSILEF